MIKTRVAAIAVVLMAGSAMAAQIPGLELAVPTNGGGARHVAKAPPLVDDGVIPVPLPMPGDPTGGNGLSKGISAAVPGPVSSTDILGVGGSGSGFVAPAGGGAMMTPEQRAEREIRSLVKKLG